MCRARENLPRAAHFSVQDVPCEAQVPLLPHVTESLPLRETRPSGYAGDVLDVGAFQRNVERLRGTTKKKAFAKALGLPSQQRLSKWLGELKTLPTLQRLLPAAAGADCLLDEFLIGVYAPYDKVLARAAAGTALAEHRLDGPEKAADMTQADTNTDGGGLGSNSVQNGDDGRSPAPPVSVDSLTAPATQETPAMREGDLTEVMQALVRQIREDEDQEATVAFLYQVLSRRRRGLRPPHIDSDTG